MDTTLFIPCHCSVTALSHTKHGTLDTILVHTCHASHIHMHPHTWLTVTGVGRLTSSHSPEVAEAAHQVLGQEGGRIPAAFRQEWQRDELLAKHRLASVASDSGTGLSSEEALTIAGLMRPVVHIAERGHRGVWGLGAGRLLGVLTPLPVVVTVAMAARKQQGVNVLSHHASLLMRFWYLMMRYDVHQARGRAMRSTPTENQQHDADTRRVRAGRKMIGHQRPHGKIDDVPVAGLKRPYLLSSPLSTRQSI